MQLCSLLNSKQIYCILSSPLSFQDFIGYGRQQEAKKSSVLLQERADYSQGTVLTLTPREQLQCQLQESGLSTTHEAQETENHHGHQIQGLVDTKQAICLWAAALASLKTFLILTRVDRMENLIQKPVVLPTSVRLREIQWDLVLTFGKQTSLWGLCA